MIEAVMLSSRAADRLTRMIEKLNAYVKSDEFADKIARRVKAAIEDTSGNQEGV